MDDRHTKVKMSGYLLKKSKKRVISTWRTYWFVLEDRLLLYYRSKDEYQAISPCKGSINLGPPCAVKSCPSITNAFQLQTRTNTFTLKADTSEEQMKWMEIILAALNQNQNFVTDKEKRLSHFRYSLDNLVPEKEPENDSSARMLTNFGRQNSMPHKKKMLAKTNSDIIQRLQKLGAQSYGGSLGAICKLTKKTSGAGATHQSSDGRRKTPPESAPKESVRQDRSSNIYERISTSSQESNRCSFMVDNENYSVPIRRSSSSVSQANKNNRSRETRSLIVENDHYSTTPKHLSDEGVYAEPKTAEVTDENRNSVLQENSLYASADMKSNDSSENIYEDLDKYNHYSKPAFISDETISTSSQECKNISEITEKEGKKTMKKTKSFIKRVWKRKNKKKDKSIESVEEDIYEEIQEAPVDKKELTDEGTIHMLSELHNILESKKYLLKAAASSNSHIGGDHDSNKEDKPSSCSSSPPPDCPNIPPKSRKAVSYDTQTLKSSDDEQFRSLDEILDDLDKEKLELKNKVKILIEKFEENDSDEVVLRTHDKPDFKINRYSNDLNVLLNELAKVTSAPIMTPGVTSSLVNPNFTDEEWLKLLPVRRRRLSEPDYDVPRPHKSITLPAKEEQVDAIPVTRFFGPVLPPDNVTKNDSLTASMTPDSLEVESLVKVNTPTSYTSHNYYDSESNVDITNYDDKIIYSLPKSYLSVSTHVVNTCDNLYGCQQSEDFLIYKTVTNLDIEEEVYSDSLETTYD